jgi:hypothetical protein
MTQQHWYRGSLHIHTNQSDGDCDPEAAGAWYKRNGYDFISLTDHNCVTALPEAEDGDFLAIPGEEVTTRVHDGNTAIHLNALGIDKAVAPITNDDVAVCIQQNVDAILQAGGVPVINHPNYTWAFDDRILKTIEGAVLVEIHNAHPAVNTPGCPGRPGCEEIWDGVLTSGRLMYGIATDDAHHFQGDFLPSKGNPGRGWVMVRAAALECEDILNALKRGDFYASTGVTLQDIKVDSGSMAVQVCQERDFVCCIDFIGRQGQLLQRCPGLEAEYRIQGHEGYVRAVVRRSDGTKAWVQPVRVG